ncbi:MAG: pyridoxal phosphate-dependent aminotransferase [Deltaproteobacteria bacterium]|nr:pyridoxal phosphate-dependent aminotransferase [Deltaproteobacteria bacterium]
MPRLASSVLAMGGPLYSAYAHRLSQLQGEVYPFHVGDTWMEPPVGARMQDLTVERFPGMHRYDPPRGRESLLRALAARYQQRHQAPTAPANLLIAAGATGALGAAVGATVGPGDEVLILSPHWPLIAGVVKAFHGRAVEVPFFGAVSSAEEAVAAVEAHRTQATVALYLNNPSNPTGLLIPRAWLVALVAWARAHDLWIYADEVYEAYAWGGEHVPCRGLAPERTLSLHSFSKAWGMAGNRVGYLIGPEEVVGMARRVGTHTYYAAPTAGQIAALQALESGSGDLWSGRAAALYRELGEEAAALLRVPAPQGSTFLFLDVAQALDERGLEGLLLDAVDRGLLVAPGPSFGPYPHHIRVCYTASPPEVTRRGLQVLAALLR